MISIATCARSWSPEPDSLEDHFDLQRGIATQLFAGSLQWLMRFLFRLSFQLEVAGLQNLPKTGPFLLCPNHQSYLDPFFLLAHLPPDLRERTLFVADRSYFSKPSLSWMNRFGRVLLTSGPPGRADCLSLACEGLKRGMIVCIFPEGRRTRTGTIMNPYRGAGILSCETGAPIVPVLIQGALQVFSNLHGGFQFCRIALTIGEPVRPVSVGGNGCRAVLVEWRNALLRLKSSPVQPVYLTN